MSTPTGKAAAIPATPAPVIAPPAAAPSGAPQAPAGTEAPAEAREERVRMPKLRQTIARRLKEAQNTAAMLTTFNEADMSAVMAVRKVHKEEFQERHGVGLGFMIFFVKACVSALRQFEGINAYIDGDEVEYHDYVDVSVAVDVRDAAAGEPEIVAVVDDEPGARVLEVQAGAGRVAGGVDRSLREIGPLPVDRRQAARWPVAGAFGQRRAKESIELAVRLVARRCLVGDVVGQQFKRFNSRPDAAGRRCAQRVHSDLSTDSACISCAVPIIQQFRALRTISDL